MPGKGPAARDPERIARLRRELCAAGFDACACTLPSDVLLLSGYWPVVGTAIAVATREGAVGVVAPEDERELAEPVAPDVLRLFRPGSLGDLRGTIEAVRGPLAHCLTELGVSTGRVGWEAGPGFVPAPYAALHLYGAALGDLLRELVPRARLEPAGVMLARARSLPTAAERARIGQACRIAEHAFAQGAARLHAGLSEAEIAAEFRAPLSTHGLEHADLTRADGYVFCMAGPNSARAHGSHAQSSGRRVELGELALVHCNSYADGFWTDITRTYALGPLSPRHRAMYDAVLAAREAALASIRPGAAATAVDGATREALAARGFGEAFKHSTGHGVGFAAIDHQARPRLHPRSPDLLETGMVFNVEPAIYLSDAGGLRHCDMVVVGERGPEVLTSFHVALEQLVIEG